MKNHPAKVDILPEFVRSIVFQRWMILILLSVILTVLLVPKFRFIPTKFNVGMILEKDIKADHDFLVEDVVATQQRKIDAARNLEPVYDYDKDAPSSICNQVTRAFSIVRHRYYRSNGGETDEPVPPATGRDTLRKIKGDFEKAVGTVLTDQELAFLHKNRFSSEIGDRLVQFIQSLYSIDLVSHEEYMKWAKSRGVIVRDIKTQKEEDRKDLSSVLDMENIDRYLQDQSLAVLGREPADLRRMSISLAKRLIQPNLTFNKDATEKRKQFVLDHVKPVYFKVSRNEVIARAGDRLTPDDLLKIDALYKTGGGTLFSRTTFLGIMLILMVLSAVLYHISKNLVKNIDKTNTDILFLSVVAVLQMFLVRAGIFISESIAHTLPYISAEALFYAIPFAMSALMVNVFLNRYIAFVFSIFSSFLITFLFDAKISMFLFSFLGSSVSSYHMAYFKQRSAFFKAGLFAGMVNMLVILCIVLISGNFASADTILKLFMGLIGGVLSGAIVAGITPVFESLFRYTTDIKLLELSNLDQPILQRMIVEAPGTYHHSIIVASMVEAAAEAISANSLLAKVSAYYHDIGKINKPLYFIENQQGWKNKHDKLSPKMSSLVIISHVKDGCELAQKYKLGRAITDIIRQHHGMSIVGYFYEKAQKDKDPSIRSIPESDFRYPGPKPQTKEAGLVLLGDVVEASSRALSDPTPSRIKNLVQSRIKQVFTDGQLDDCELTMRDLNKISESFVRTLNAIFHHRINYSEPAFRDNGSRKDSNGYPDHKPAEKNKTRH
ncbi:MAG: HD family phosphohydrolase [Syntrophales bacterium]